MKLVFQATIFRCYVSFREGRSRFNLWSWPILKVMIHKKKKVIRRNRICLHGGQLLEVYQLTHIRSQENTLTIVDHQQNLSFNFSRGVGMSSQLKTFRPRISSPISHQNGEVRKIMDS